VMAFTAANHPFHGISCEWPAVLQG
jgi:hypothetical protein